MSKKITVTTFTDPMMGLSWVCEPIFRKLETHFAGQIEFHTVMALLVRSFDYQDFVSVISQLTDDAIKPHSVEHDVETLRGFLRKHPLISPIELHEAFDLADTNAARELLQPLIESGEVEIEEVYHGWFIRLKQGA